MLFAFMRSLGADASNRRLHLRVFSCNSNKNTHVIIKIFNFNSHLKLNYVLVSTIGSKDINTHNYIAHC